MTYTIIGLRNPGGEYAGSRHNVSDLFIDALATEADAVWKTSVKAKAEEGKGDIAGKKVTLLKSEEFMNNNGRVVAPYIKTPKDKERLVVIYDDIDLPIGSLKLSFDRSSGGHKGLESVIRSLKSKDFLRIRIGICPTTPGGKKKKPTGEAEVVDFILGKFKPTETELLKKLQPKVVQVVTTFIEQGKDAAVMEGNTQ